MSCCFFSGAIIPIAPPRRLSLLFASQSLIVLWTHPLHFISCQLVKLSFHKKFTCFHRNSTWQSFKFSLDSTLYNYYDLFVYLVQVLFHLLQLTPLKIVYIGFAAAFFKPVGFFLFQHCNVFRLLHMTLFARCNCFLRFCFSFFFPHFTSMV